MRYLQFALRNNELISIIDVPSGLECGCVCPECGATLVAKKGNRRMRHFSHYQTADCEKGIETALHILGKQIIERTKRLFVPSIPSVEKSVGKVTEYDEAVEENKIDGIIKPDVQLRARMDLWGAGRVVNVEIKVSHAVDEAKKYKLLDIGIPTIEMGLFAQSKAVFHRRMAVRHKCVETSLRQALLGRLLSAERVGNGLRTLVV